MNKPDMVTGMQEERKGYRVTINDSDVFHLSAAEYRQLPLALGETLDWEAYRKNLLFLQYPDALNRAVAALAARAQSRAELERKLQARGYLSDTVELVLYKLDKENLIDDAAFARAWVAARSARQLGKARILQELRYKGISSDVAEAAVAELDRDDTASQALNLMAKLLRRYDDPSAPDARRTTIAAMQRRGFTYGEANQAYQEAVQQLQEDNEE